VRYSLMMPFFDSFFTCFSFRFSFSDLPTFLALCWCGDFSPIVVPHVGGVIVGDADTTDLDHLLRIRLH